MMKWIKAAAGAVLVGLVLWVCGFVGACTTVRESVVRMHILANSDSEADQAVKMQVRDAVTAAGAGLLDGVTSRAEAEQRLQEALPRLTAVAQECVQKAGFSYPVKAELTEMYFMTRIYENGTFPAGRYHAVRLSLGEAKGKNWWCVMYPPLCVSAATDKNSLRDVLPGEACTVVEDGSRFVIRFKVLEWVQELAEWFSVK